MYLDSQHNFVHIINPSRFWQSFYGPPSNRPPMMLLYSMWSIATHVNNKYSQLNEEFYRRARQYADMDEARVCSLTQVFCLRMIHVRYAC